ncbi:MAG: TetM/TetW/TetO/TetS family tetracycline resistance ribosomal protection protein [Clostridia bacterium]|nr:TetM/TetW/TetO/TetS family tetracycline resistance ribosomal protection protein [Clostridia bacterium]
MKKAVLGILAHVDAGKTTLAEALLYKTGALRSPGKVDSGNTVMDSHRLEKERGITIFSSQAQIETDKIIITLLDTPGHIDFSTETERVLGVIDYAVLVISANDGVQSHTLTVFRLLKHYNIPCFIFVTKTDYERKTKEEILNNLCGELSPNCIDFNDDNKTSFYENIASTSEDVLEKYLETETVSDEDISSLIRSRRIFPVYFGSGTNMNGIDEFISGLEKYIEEPLYPNEFGAKVYKITHDKGTRLTHLKVTGGILQTKDAIDIDGTAEKINQIRIYNGEKYTAVDKVSAGDICAVSGLQNSFDGQGFGYENMNIKPVLEPVMVFNIILPADTDAMTFLPKLKMLEEEEPQLQIKWDEVNGKIQVALMGEIQAEILKSTIADRFGIDIEVANGSIQYKETVKSAVEGVGHYEPLRHYAEVHVIIEPGKRNSGIKIGSNVSEDVLDRNWQRLIKGNIAEKKHPGVLTGSELTDVKITLCAGRAHLKHTEGGDFRQATYRAIRQGLMNAENVLLEPYCSFKLEIPYENLGRAINDIHRMSGTFETPDEKAEFCVIKGRAPFSEINDYAGSVASYTSGKGHLALEFGGYDECHNSEKVIEEKGYNPESDIENTPDSVFCAHGAGFTVKWDKVNEYMHLDYTLKKNDSGQAVNKRNTNIDEREIEEIIKREFGNIETKLYRPVQKPVEKNKYDDIIKERKKWLIVDGYNVIFALDDLKEFADSDLAGARKVLMDILANYSAFTNINVVLVFDAYKVPGNQGEKFDYNNIHVVYTKERELADVYIGKIISEIGKNDQVTVVSSDGLIQLSAVKSGVLRKSTDDFASDLEITNRKISEFIEKLKNKKN